MTDSQLNPDRTYTVQGMTCSPCAVSVHEEISEVAGVGNVDVDLAYRRVTVSGEGFTDGSIRTAVEAASYEVVS